MQNTNKMTALYCRLSQDDGFDNVESNSITHQKEILTKYARDHGFGNTQFFIDDGVTGTSFNRPGLNAMLAEIKLGNVSTVIIKDQSRIGRDVLEVGLLKRTFEENNVRFIAANDNLDSANGFDIMSIFRDVFNEWFVADTSKKIRAVFKAKAQSGKHHTSKAPYGYKSSKDDPFVWDIDEFAADVVREIFQMCINGMGPKRIANVLRERKLDIPEVYRSKNNGTPPPREYKHPDYWWTSATVGAILKNLEYTGTAVTSYGYTKSYKDHTYVAMPEEERLIFENAHEAIVDREIFDIVQRIRDGRRKRPAKHGDVGLLNGLLFCADCGSIMHIKRRGIDEYKQYIYYNCKRNRGSTDGLGNCTPHSIRSDRIEKLVLDDLRRVIRSVQYDEQRFAENLQKSTRKDSEKRQRKIRTEYTKIENRVKTLDRIMQKLYEDRVDGSISDERFFRMLNEYETEQSELTIKAADLKIEIEKLDGEIGNIDSFVRLVKKYSEIEELTMEMAREFICRIEVGETVIVTPRKHSHWKDEKRQDIKIVYNYIGIAPQDNDVTISET